MTLPSSRRPVFVAAIFMLDLYVHVCYSYMYMKGGSKVSPRTGRPPSEYPKNIQVKFLADQPTVDDLGLCAAKLGKTKSDIIRMGIQRVKAELDEK